MDRRNFISTTAGAAGIAALTAAGVAGAEENKMNHAAMGKPNPYLGLINSSLDCIKTASICLEHCIKTLGTGDTSLKNCANKVIELEVICSSLARLASYESQHLKELAKVAVNICIECEKECKKHKEHQVCLACAKSCAECLKECKSLGV
ncbi:MAG: four-helix bundle copper-binding protein [Nitrospinae bacterium]|nr:four-helix bundle copper-binding protein [Nitrospinota bacterium]